MVVAFGACELDVDRLELRRGRVAVPVEPQVFDVLTHLVQHRDRVVTKNELLDEVWGSRFVSESALTSRIKSARRAIGDTGRDQRMIKTIHGRGYRFVADVRPELSTVAAPVVVHSHAAPDAAIVEALDALGAGAGRAVAVVGAVSAGKSDLLHHAAELALARGHALGRSDVSGLAARPLQPVIEALDELVQRDHELLEDLPPRCAIELETVFAGRDPSTEGRFFVAVRELLVTAAARSGAVLVVDDVHLADETTVAFLDEAIRLSRHHPLLVLVAQRPGTPVRPGCARIELSAPAESPTGHAEDGLAPDVRDALRRVALGGRRFDLIEVRAAAGLDEAPALRLVDIALQTGLAERTANGYQFVDDDVSDRLAAGVPTALVAGMRHHTGTHLARLGAAPSRVAEHLLAAGTPDDAFPYVLVAVRQAAAAGLHADVLRWSGAVRGAAPRDETAELRSLEADARAAIGDPGAAALYREALSYATPEEGRGIRARLARAALFAGDLAAAEEALSGIEPDGGPYDGVILLVGGMLAYFSQDLDRAQDAADAARQLALAPGAPDLLLDVIALDGMIAHDRGSYFDRLQRELRSGEDSGVVSKVFDSHLCVAEYMLYGPTPYDEVIRLSHRLRERAEQSGAQRAAAFAVAVAGEAALLSGDLEAARGDLTEAVELHVAIRADTGAAHALQRLAEVELADGRPEEATRLLRRALPLARWSPLARHLLQRTYGTLIASAPDAQAAMDLVGEAQHAMDERKMCEYCHVMIAVPAAIASAEAGELDQAKAFLEEAELSASLWQGTAWKGAVTEARAHLARSEGDAERGDELLVEAAVLFERAGQPLDAARCREASS